jgi:hypothetical protein
MSCCFESAGFESAGFESAEARRRSSLPRLPTLERESRIFVSEAA